MSDDTDPRPLVRNFSQSIRIDQSSLSNLVITQKNYMYTCAMDLKDGTIYIASLARPSDEVDDHYSTKTPKYQDAFPCFVMNKKIDPIVHKGKSGITSHHQLACFIIDNKAGCKLVDFCGFSLRYDQDKKMSFSPTSRTLNGSIKGRSNGCLEDILSQKICAFLAPKLKMLNIGISKVEARVDPASAAVARGGVVIPVNLLSRIQEKK